MGWELGKLDRSTIKEVARHRAEKGERSSLQAGGGGKEKNILWVPESG